MFAVHRKALDLLEIYIRHFLIGDDPVTEVIAPNIEFDHLGFVRNTFAVMSTLCTTD